MKKIFYLRNLAALLLLSSSVALTSCDGDDPDIAEPTAIANMLAGNYIISGKVYSYSGPVSWPGPPAPIPASYVSSVNLATLSPKTATSTNSLTTRIDFADFVSPDYYYVFTSPGDFSTLSYALSSTPSTNFSNINKYVVSYTAPTATTKASFHIMTHYTDNPTGTGNSRIVDETFVQQ